MTVEFNVLPEYVYIEDSEFRTIKTEYDLGIAQTRAYWLRPRRTFTLNWDNAIQSEKDQVVSFFREQVGSAGAFIYQLPDAVPSPFSSGNPSTQPQTVGSAYVARTYYYAYSWVTAYGETLIGAVSSLALAEDTLFLLTLPRFPTNVIAARIYVSSSSPTSLQLQAEISVTGGTWIEPDNVTVTNGLTSGANIPTANTALEKVNVRFLEDTLKWSKKTPVSYSMTVSFQELFS